MHKAQDRGRYDHKTVGRQQHAGTNCQYKANYGRQQDERDITIPEFQICFTIQIHDLYGLQPVNGKRHNRWNEEKDTCKNAYHSIGLGGKVFCEIGNGYDPDQGIDYRKNIKIDKTHYFPAEQNGFNLPSKKIV